MDLIVCAACGQPRQAWSRGLSFATKNERGMVEYCEPCGKVRDEILAVYRWEPHRYVPASEIVARRLDAALDDLIVLRERLSTE